MSESPRLTREQQTELAHTNEEKVLHWLFEYNHSSIPHIAKGCHLSVPGTRAVIRRLKRDGRLRHVIHDSRNEWLIG
jgi:hypothetical protein